MDKILLIGMGGLGKEILSYIKVLSKEIEVIGYYDDFEKKIELPYLGGILTFHKQYNAIITLSDPPTKKIVAERCGLINSPVLNYGRSFNEKHIGAGSIICPGVVLTSDVEIGKHCLVNLNATIGHDVVIGSYSSIMPGANISGSVKIGESVMIGTGAQILQGIRIGDNAIVGAGAVVTKDVEPGVTVVGVPARVI